MPTSALLPDILRGDVGIAPYNAQKGLLHKCSRPF